MKGGETSFTGSELGRTEPAGQCTYAENVCEATHTQDSKGRLITQ